MTVPAAIVIAVTILGIVLLITGIIIVVTFAIVSMPENQSHPKI